MFLLIIVVLLAIFMYYCYYNFITKKESLANQKNFLPSNKFSGYKKGYVFKNCSMGLGYYKDIYDN